MTKYKDDLENGYVNGYYVGKSMGAKTPDALDQPDDDGYKMYREFERFGTVTQDAATPGYPEPLENDEGGSVPPEGGEE
ncbi:hypothetical protein [Sporosarcina sp. USHLN248]|uniref:hypothetical protein n=1 Tax=Sporosarcina sp. USHLN248 TaxID=3081300 RepID=UPI0030161049